MNSSGDFSADGALDDRFAFGENWARFLRLMNEDRIREAEASLRDMLGVTDLSGKRFVDIGSGSGLFSLAARRLGASVHSFDFDPSSVACTAELRRRYFPDDARWTVERASALDQEYLRRLGRFDVVYSWGVLHHTGAMWRALRNVAALVEDEGLLFIAIYNDQGWVTRYWHAVKRVYVQWPVLRWPLLLVHAIYPLLPVWIMRAVRGARSPGRGMSLWRDLVDWVGGFPFETARPEDIFRLYRENGFVLERLKTTRRLGCNEFVFIRTTCP